MIFLLDTGVRLNETLAVRWVEVDFSRSRIEVYRTKTNSVSYVPLSSRLRDNLNHRQNQPAPFEAMSRAVRILRKTIDRECNGDDRIVAQRGAATIHSLRDTFTTRLAGKGMSVTKIGAILGHSSVHMTSRYSRLGSADVLDEANRILGTG